MLDERVIHVVYLFHLSLKECPFLLKFERLSLHLAMSQLEKKWKRDASLWCKALNQPGLQHALDAE